MGRSVWPAGTAGGIGPPPLVGGGDVGALAERGFPGFSALAWWGIFGTAGTPKPILDKFHAELVKVFNRPEVRKQLTDTLGMDVTASSPEDTQKFLVSQVERWGKVVRENNIRME